MDADRRTSLDCSIVIPVYFNEQSIEPTLDLIEREVIAKNPGRTFEVIFVDDGSGDGSPERSAGCPAASRTWCE